MLDNVFFVLFMRKVMARHGREFNEEEENQWKRRKPVRRKEKSTWTMEGEKKSRLRFIGETRSYSTIRDQCIEIALK
jgi:hypothetical protein